MNILKKYASLPDPVRASLWFLICGITQKCISVITTPIFTRIMTTEQYGEFTLYTSWSVIISVVIGLRLHCGVFMQGLVRYDDDKDEYTAAMQGLTTTLTLAAFALYLPLQGFWNNLTGLNTFLTLCAIFNTWATSMFGFWSTRQRVEYKYRALVGVTLCVSVLVSVGGIVAVLLADTYKVEARVAVIAVVEFAFYIVMFVRYMVRGKKFYVRSYWIRALKFNIPLIPHYLSQSVLNQADRIMIKAIVGAGAAGIYGLAHSLSWITNVVSSALNQTMAPWIYQKIRDKDYTSIASVSYVTMSLVGAVNLAVIAFAPEIIYVFAPPPYYEAIWLIAPLSGSVFVMFMYELFADFEFYYERTSRIAFASVMGAVVNIVLNMVFIPLFGYICAGYTTLASYGIYIIAHYAFMRDVQKRDMGGVKVYDPKVIIGLCLAFAAAAALLVLLYPLLPVRIVIAVAVAGLVVFHRKRLMGIWAEMRSAKKEK